MKEKRRYARVRFPRRVWCEASDGTQLARIEDASEEGVFVRTPRPASEGEAVELTIVAEPTDIVLRARVVWSSRDTVGAARRGMGLRIERFVRGSDLYGALLGEQRRNTSSPGWLQSPGASRGS